jgi:RimJ/RimL family protein N-acetyltransferase
MVAEKCSRRKGIAQEALHTMMCYAIGTLQAEGFTAKITTSNVSSRALFEKIGFVRVKDVPCFDEVHYEMSSSLAPEAWERLVVDSPLLNGLTTAWE